MEGVARGREHHGVATELHHLVRPMNGATVEKPTPDFDTEIHEALAAKLGVPALKFRPRLLQNWMLVLNLLLEYCMDRSVGPGTFYQLCLFVHQILSTQQVVRIGWVMPYCSMASTKAEDRVGRRTMCADYFPYDWPDPRPRSALNGHWFFFANEIALFVASYAVVQFASNILRVSYDPTTGAFRGWLPNKGIIYIVLGCHSIFAFMSIAILAWLWDRKTGLFAQPGSIAMLIGILQSSQLGDDFCGLDREARRWKIRERLGSQQYRIRYWRVPGESPVYGIRKTGNVEPRYDLSVQQPRPDVRRSALPRFHFIPWFLRQHWIAFWIALLVAGLSVALTLYVHDDISYFGFAPRASTHLLPVVEFSSASFLWSFFPSLIADQYRLLFKNVDMFYRTVQPYADLQLATASSNALTANYVEDLPIFVTLKAWLKGSHGRIVLTSLVSLISSFVPALAANMFYQDYDDLGAPRIYLQKTYFWLVIDFMILLIICFWLLIPDERYFLPHDLETLSDHISFLHQSNLLSKNEFHLDIPLNPQQATEADVQPKNGQTWKNRLGDQLAAIKLKIKGLLRQIQGIRWKEVLSDTLQKANPLADQPYEAQVKQRLKDRETSMAFSFGAFQQSDGPARCWRAYGRHDTFVVYER